MIITLKDVNIVSDNCRIIPIIVKGKPRSVTSSEYKKCKFDTHDSGTVTGVVGADE